MPDQESGRARFLRTYQQAAPHTTAGLQYGITIIICLFIGRWVDGRTGTRPLFLIVGIFLGAVAGFYNLYRSLVQQERERKGSDR